MSREETETMTDEQRDERRAQRAARLRAAAAKTRDGRRADVLRLQAHLLEGGDDELEVVDAVCELCLESLSTVILIDIGTAEAIPACAVCAERALRAL